VADGPETGTVPGGAISAAGAGRRGGRAVGLVFGLLRSEYLVLGLAVLYLLAMWPIVPEIATPDNLSNIGSELLPLFIAATGQMFVLVTGNVDLSATSGMAFASVVGASLMTDDGGYLAGNPAAVPVACAAILVIGVAIGWANGICVAFFGMPSFIVTLATMMFFSGAAIWYTASHTSEGSSIGSLPDGFLAIGEGGAFGISYALLITLGIGVAAHLVLSRSVFGRWLFAVGLSPRTAAVSGVPVRRMLVASFMASGGLSALAAIIYTGRLEAGTPVLGQRILLDMIGAAVIGGVSLFGGKAKVTWVLFGVIFLSVVDNGLQLLGLSLFSVYAIKGGLILFAAVTDVLRQHLPARA
jgi:ribose/xylose/arabinose/galactoside ABC-type transport system permease subunit